nr:uncharacterized mitochondrial protein AtMg00810-like [Tanacetum cinerariifolium]
MKEFLSVKRLKIFEIVVNHTSRFNTIITSLKDLDEGFSSKNYVMKFFRALHSKWRAKVMAIEESIDLSSLALDGLIGNLKVHEVVMNKDSKIYRGKKERVKSIGLKIKKESSDDETLTSKSNDEEYGMAKGKNDRKCFRRGDPNHLIGDYPKPARNKDQKAFIGGSLSDSENDTEDKTNDETCLMAQSSNEVCLRTCLEPDEWIKDSRCSKHMTGNKSLFSTYKAYEEHNVVFGSNLKGKIIGKGKTPYEIFRGRKSYLEYFKVFGSKCFIINTKDYLTKFDPKSYEGVFLGCSQNRKAYVVLNKHTMKVKESLNVTFNESPLPTNLSPLVNDDVGKEEAIENNTKVVNNSNEEYESIEVDEVINIKEYKNHPLEQVKEDEIFFNQSKYIMEMLKKFGLEDSKPTKKPMSTGIKLTKDIEADSVDCTKYQGMIGSLLYFTASRPDIMFNVYLCARFQENPKTTHLEAVKHIFRYIRGTIQLGLWNPKGTRIETIVYADFDHADDYIDRKSTSSVCTFMVCFLTSWFAKKQMALAISTTEAEYVATEKA